LYCFLKAEYINRFSLNLFWVLEIFLPQIFLQKNFFEHLCELVYLDSQHNQASLFPILKLLKKASYFSFFLFSFCCYQRSQLYYTNNYTHYELNYMEKKKINKKRIKITSIWSYFFNYVCFAFLCWYLVFVTLMN